MNDVLALCSKLPEMRVAKGDTLIEEAVRTDRLCVLKGQALAARIAEQMEGPRGEFAGGWAGEIAVQRVELGQGLLIDRGVAVGKGLGRRAALVAQMPLAAKLPTKRSIWAGEQPVTLVRKRSSSPRSGRLRWP